MREEYAKIGDSGPKSRALLCSASSWSSLAWLGEAFENSIIPNSLFRIKKLEKLPHRHTHLSFGDVSNFTHIPLPKIAIRHSSRNVLNIFYATIKTDKRNKQADHMTMFPDCSF
jgi:hypothetical protein